MKTGKSLLELATEIERQAESKRDFLADSRDVRYYADTDLLAVGSVGEFKPTEGFHDQLATGLDIPKKYYDRMMDQAPELLETNVNHWFRASPARKMIRTLDNKARAFLSEKYRPLDNVDLMQVALPVLQRQDLRVVSCEVTDKKLYLKAISPKVSHEIAKGDVVQSGIVISNSETGAGSLSIEPLLYRLVCTNGMIANDSRMRKSHVGRGMKDFEGAVEFFRDETRAADDKAFWMKVRDTLEHAFNEIDFAAIVQKMMVAKEDRILGDPIKVVELAKKDFQWTDTEHRGVLTHLLASGDMNRFGLVNAITRTAQDMPSYDRATEFERLGGRVLEMPKTNWNELAANN